MAMRDDELPDPFIQDEFDEIEREDERFEDEDEDDFDIYDIIPHWNGAV